MSSTFAQGKDNLLSPAFLLEPNEFFTILQKLVMS